MIALLLVVFSLGVGTGLLTSRVLGEKGRPRQPRWQRLPEWWTPPRTSR